MHLPRPRGPVSRHVVESLRRAGPAAGSVALGTGPVSADPDVQLALWVLYELHYRGFEDAAGDHEWDPELLRLRGALERRFEHELREATRDLVAGADDRDVVDALLALVAGDNGPSVAAFLHRRADADQVREYLRERSLQQLKESDPQSFLLPRLAGAAKVALAEIQYDEYGGGRPERLHQALYARTLEAAGLDASYGAYVDEVSAASLAEANVMSLFALNRRLRGASAGHFAAFEATSSVPSRKVSIGLERLGFPDAVAAYFHEHVEADAVHEQVAARDLCGSMVREEPALREDVLFGAACVVHLDAAFSRELLDRWNADDEPRLVAS
ncbi:MAG: iron-containing redox enzyme family protein [Marmoricola sp.]|nr:iron-containing redox enzyme family protein [Marmoricola sp.]